MMNIKRLFVAFCLVGFITHSAEEDILQGSLKLLHSSESKDGKSICIEFNGNVRVSKKVCESASNRKPVFQILQNLHSELLKNAGDNLKGKADFTEALRESLPKDRYLLLEGVKRYNQAIKKIEDEAVLQERALEKNLDFLIEVTKMRKKRKIGCDQVEAKRKKARKARMARMARKLSWGMKR